jgi:TPR repeat protein
MDYKVTHIPRLEDPRELPTGCSVRCGASVASTPHELPAAEAVECQQTFTLQNGETEFQNGMEFLLCGLIQDSLPHFLKAAEVDYPPAFLILTLVYDGELGSVLQEDSLVAFYSAKVASSIAYFQDAVNQPHLSPQCHFHLACCYAYAFGVQRSSVAEMVHLQDAAAGGCPLGQLRLGFCWRHGQAVEQEDDELAFQYYSMACRAGYALAQYEVAFAYLIGRGVKKDLVKAFHYASLSADQGFHFAQWLVAVCYNRGEGVTKDLNMSLHYHTLAAAQHHPMSEHQLAVWYDEGFLLDQDPVKAFQFYERAALHGTSYPRHQYDLGCYADGFGVIKNEKLAFKYLFISAHMEFSPAEEMLGWCYEHSPNTLLKSFLTFT